MRDFYEWNEEMLRLIVDCIDLLVKTTRMFDEFRNGDIKYFDIDSESGPSHSIVFEGIEKSFSSLRLSLNTLENLRPRLTQENRHAVCSFLSSNAFKPLSLPR